MLYKLFCKIRQAVLAKLTVVIYYPFLFVVYKPKHKSFQPAELAQMPQGSLGNSVISVWAENNLSKIRNYELHDAKHLLLGYGINYEGEIQMQYFELGNGNRSLPVCVAIVVGTVFAPEYIGQYIRAYKRGKSCRYISDSYLQVQMLTDLNQLKNQLAL
jgi:ubiquinone biosynthesis protein Coq4